MTEVERINRWLLEQYHFEGGSKPLYKIVWSEEATEVRHGTYNDYYGDIYLRTVTETRTIKKYNYLSEKWVLEKWAPPERSATKELPESITKGSYEPIWVFQTAKGEYLPPVLKAVEIIVGVDQKGLNRMTPEERKDYFDRLEEKEVEYFRDSIDTNATLSALHQREGIGYGRGLSRVSSIL